MKLRKISDITATLPFTEFNFMQKYRESFAVSELGRIYAQLPLKEMAEKIRSHFHKKHHQGNTPLFPPEGEVALKERLPSNKYHDINPNRQFSRHVKRSKALSLRLLRYNLSIRLICRVFYLLDSFFSHLSYQIALSSTLPCQVLCVPTVGHLLACLSNSLWSLPTYHILPL